MSSFGKTATQWGNDHEDLAAQRFSELYAKDLVYFGLFIHPDYRWLGASPDRVTSDGWLLEIKRVVARMRAVSTQKSQCRRWPRVKAAARVGPGGQPKARASQRAPSTVPITSTAARSSSRRACTPSRSRPKMCLNLHSRVILSLRGKKRRCPITRQIKANPPGVPLMEDGDHVPPYYRDQMLLLMEVMDLDHAYYMEWVPETTWRAEEVGVTVVHRDREWFAASLPKLRAFYDEMVALRELPRSELESRFPPRNRRSPPQPRPRVWAYLFESRGAWGLPSGEPDEFYDGPPELYSSRERERALAECEFCPDLQTEENDQGPAVPAGADPGA